MDMKKLKKDIEELMRLSHDDEAAHSFEDGLREDVLMEIAEGNPEGQEMAKEVLKTSEIIFARWCA